MKYDNMGNLIPSKIKRVRKPRKKIQIKFNFREFISLIFPFRFRKDFISVSLLIFLILSAIFFFKQEYFNDTLPGIKGFEFGSTFKASENLCDSNQYNHRPTDKYFWIYEPIVRTGLKQTSDSLLIVKSITFTNSIEIKEMILRFQDDRLYRIDVRFSSDFQLIAKSFADQYFLDGYCCGIFKNHYSYIEIDGSWVVFIDNIILNQIIEKRREHIDQIIETQKAEIKRELK